MSREEKREHLLEDIQKLITSLNNEGPVTRATISQVNESLKDIKTRVDLLTQATGIVISDIQMVHRNRRRFPHE